MKDGKKMKNDHLREVLHVPPEEHHVHQVLDHLEHLLKEHLENFPLVKVVMNLVEVELLVIIKKIIFKKKYPKMLKNILV